MSCMTGRNPSLQDIIADLLFFIQPSYKSSPPWASAITKAEMLSQALSQKSDGLFQPFAIKICPSRISQACEIGFSYFSIKSV